jgi:hypothetical protein
MKRALSLLFVGLFLILIMPFVFAEDELTEQEKVDEAYQCLTDKVTGNCDSLSLEQKTFSLLAINQCRSELVSDSQNGGECWPSGNCGVKETAQAIIALDNSGSGATDAKDWLLNQEAIPGNVEWFLEVDTLNISTCSVAYSGTEYNFDVLENKKLTNNAGNCLSRVQDDYWFRISPSCFSKEFKISCDESFLTTLLFKKTDYSTIHVSSTASSASADGLTFEKVESSCLGKTNCDYEGTLWSAMALESLGEDISKFLPYLITSAEDNSRLIPETFLYFLTANEDYRSQVLLGQKNSQWWSESGDKYYDTALALYPFQTETPVEKENSKNWLLTAQDEEGCWQGNIRNTAFILASLWPKSFSSSGGGGGSLDCESAGNYCVSRSSCNGEILGEFDCPGFSSICCSVPQVLETCSEKEGKICSSGEICRGNLVATEDSSNCCVGGFCEQPSEDLTDCELEGGNCRFTCESNEEESELSCSGSGGICCILSGSEDKSPNTLWIWILLILILLVILGIVFRDKLRPFWFRIKSKFGKGKPGPPATPRIPGRHRPLPHPRRPVRPMSRVPERKIIPTSPMPRPAKQVPRRPSKSQKELDEVLKKLKKMSE